MRRNDQPNWPNAMTCSRFSLLKTWLMTTEANFPLQQLCLKPSLYGRFSLDHLWPVLGDHRGLSRRDLLEQLRSGKAHRRSLGFLRISCQGLVASANLVRLSSKKAAYVAVNWCCV